MNPFDLTFEDIQLLIEAMQAWEEKETRDDTAGMLLATLLAPSRERAEESFRKFEERDRRRKPEQFVRRQRSIVMQAKLLALRDAIEAGVDREGRDA